MSALGLEETQVHHFAADSLAELGAEVDAFVATGLGEWKLEGVALDASFRQFTAYLEPVRTLANYEAAVTLTRWRRP